MKKLKILLITALFSIFLFSCNSNKSSSQVDDIDPGLDSVCYTESLVTNLTHGGYFKCIDAQRINVRPDSSHVSHKMFRWVLKSEYSIDVTQYVSEEISDLNFSTIMSSDYKDKLGGTFEQISPWTLDTVYKDAEYSTCVYKIDKTNIVICISTIEDKSSKYRGDMIQIIEIGNYRNNPDIDLTLFKLSKGLKSINK